MKKDKNKRKRLLAVSASIALCTMLLATFAWDVYKASKENKFGNALAGGSVVVEEYFPNGHIPEGGEVDKQVWGVNTSSTAVLMRLTFEERLAVLIAEAGDPKEAKITKVTDVASAPAKGIPVPMDVNYYAAEAKLGDAGEITDSLDQWANITSQVKINGAVVPTDVTVLAKTTKETITSVGGTTSVKFTTEYAAFRKVAVADTNMGEVSKKAVVKYPGDVTSIAQRVELVDFKPVYNPDDATAAVTEFTATAAEYPFYDGLTADKLANWGNDPVDLNLGGTEAPMLPATTNTSAIDPNLTFSYKHLDTTATPGKWMYNEEDGYFYYLGVVGSGSKTSNLLDKVGLANGSGTIYAYFDYSLWVDLEGILPQEEAITSEFFKGTAPTAGTSKTIYDALVAYVTAYQANNTDVQAPLP